MKLQQLAMILFFGMIELTAAPVGAQTAVFQLRPSTVVTDDFLITQSCNKIRDDLRTEAHPERRDLLSQAMDACKQVKRHKITHEEWFAKLISIQSKAGSAYTDFIPRTASPLPAGFKSYSILLMPSIAYRADPNSRGLVQTFLSFGYAIGEQGAATLLIDPSEEADLEWSKFYCDRLGLNYNDGPYVVTSAKRPDLLRKGDELVVLRFSNIAPDRAVMLLNELERELRTQLAASKRTLEYEEVKQRMLTFKDRHSDLLKDVFVKLVPKF